MKENHMWMNGFVWVNKDNENYKTLCELWNSYIHTAAHHRLKALHLINQMTEFFTL